MKRREKSVSPQASARDCVRDRERDRERRKEWTERPIRLTLFHLLLRWWRKGEGKVTISSSNSQVEKPPASPIVISIRSNLAVVLRCQRRRKHQKKRGNMSAKEDDEEEEKNSESC